MKKKVHIYTSISRPDKKIIESFKDIGAATVYEAAGRIGSINPNIKPLRQDVKLLGTALTVNCFPRDNLMLHKAIAVAGEGDVIVASTDGCPDFGYWGGLMSTSAVSRKIVGLVIDGCIRDSEEILEMGFPVFCRGTCIRGTTKKNPGLINHPLTFGDILINPGDLILGDGDGLVAIPQSAIPKVLEASNKRIENEIDKEAKLKKGITSVELNKLDKVFESLGMVEE